jgi:hypothetical protein
MPQRNWLITGVRRGGDWERERAAGVFARGDFECFGRDYAAIRRSKAQLIGAHSDERGQIGQVTPVHS